MPPGVGGTARFGNSGADRHVLMHGKDSRLWHAPNGTSQQRKFLMHALKDLFTSDVGLMSLAGLVFMLGMGVFYIFYFLRHIREDADKAASMQRLDGDRRAPQGR